MLTMVMQTLNIIINLNVISNNHRLRTPTLSTMNTIAMGLLVSNMATAAVAYV